MVRERLQRALGYPPMCCRRATPARRAGVVLGVVLALASAGAARAEFSVCNQTLDVVNVAIGHLVGGDFTTEGWWTIGSNACASVIRDDLAVRHIFVFATDVFGQPLLDGTVPMCLADDKFKIVPGTGSCWERGYREDEFFDVDTQDQSDWRLFLTEP